MAMAMTLLGAVVVYLYFRSREPLPPRTAVSKTESLSRLRKQYFKAYTLILAAQLSTILLTITFAVAMAQLFEASNWTGLGFALAIFAFLHERGVSALSGMRGEAWFNGLRAFLNLSYGFEYLRVLDLVIQAVALLALALLGYGMLER